jgi:hypothetical protein
MIPGMANPQNWNRFSYVGNSPILYNDPTGHCSLSGHWVPDADPACQWASSNQDSLVGSGNGGFASSGSGGGDGGGGNDDDGDLPDELDSEVYLRFGQPGTVESSDIGHAGNLCNSGGMGTVVGNKSTIITADHVYSHCRADQTTLWVQVNGTWVTFSLADLDLVVGQGDIRTITLPSDLPGYIVPATMVTDHSMVSGESVTYTTYQLNYSNDKFTGVTFISGTTTVAQDWRVRVRGYGQQALLNITLRPGSSGGGVFSNGQLIGVNSFADTITGIGGTTMASFCHTWFGLVC